ncbi:uncharacterized protein THITE_2112795 [Thermothielavioides terrestris NRRL 8126]|uniref:Uncharacterized protein n=1 Tax=Thermothielavioides terrestris (strain ATCC 38088 / NRRL 8126) TaxID=578455 RepID=G2R0H5_THETT|nr:uncharacterized protein THITE_2112795 [Thermothielavioides terrestris NRRL 8126]AEO65640.1 hypothetical protein THITE_2112795 [Thermothielavioides terrestris NRRL 8126]
MTHDLANSGIKSFGHAIFTKTARNRNQFSCNCLPPPFLCRQNRAWQERFRSLT